MIAMTASTTRDEQEVAQCQSGAHFSSGSRRFTHRPINFLVWRDTLKNWDSISYAAQLPPKVAQFRVELQMIAGRVAGFVGEPWSRRIVCTVISWSFAIWELIFLSAVMQMGLALPMAYYFHRATTLGLPANLLVVPLTQLLMPAAISALALGAVWVWLAKIPVLLTTLALHGIMGTVRGRVRCRWRTCG